MWKGRDHGVIKVNYHQPHQNLVLIKDKIVCMVGLEGSPLL